MTAKPDGGPAFPTGELRAISRTHETYGNLPGMTLRDHFAATAMNARMQLGGFDETIAAESYQMADAMLAERAK